MTATTPRYGLRHPERTDPAEGWVAFEQLADDTEAALAPIDDRAATTADGLQNLRRRVDLMFASIETSEVRVSFENRDNFTVEVSYSRPFPSQPVVFTNINSAAGETARWHSRAFYISNTGFTLFVFASDGGRLSTWENRAVHWMALHHN
ncbi:H-type lectin domain-containing protein [Glycomyces sp. NPDC048151]|uniref:H-type lectin domain-containing protein n=1 Tax=Glycomyces sp. NPDC048151 TaxID=3364002 RepID=UPI00372284C8